MVEDFIFFRAGIKGKNYHGRVMFGGEEVRASNFNFSRNPIC